MDIPIAEKIIVKGLSFNSHLIAKAIPPNVWLS
jgi:hypothetical protein